MYDICHPTYYNMSQLGCNDQVKLTTAFYVYMELCEVRRYWDVEYKYNTQLQLFYLEAKQNKNSEISTFIPWPAINNITLNFISNIQHELEKEKFTFVFKEGDTTSVYYSVCSGIVKPISPDETKKLRKKENKKIKLEKEINRNTANLYERALSLNNDDMDKISEHGENNTNKEESDAEDFYTPMETFSDKDSFTFKCSSETQKIESAGETNSFNDSQKCENVKNPEVSKDCERLETKDNEKNICDLKETEGPKPIDSVENNKSSDETQIFEPSS